jgi:hypothetical protein
MTELFLLIKLSVKPEARVSAQVEVLEILDRKTKILHYILYFTTVFVLAIYIYQVVWLITLIELNLDSNLSLSEIIEREDVKGLKNFYSLTSSILLLVFALVLFVVFLMLNRTLKDNLLTQATRKDK